MGASKAKQDKSISGGDTVSGTIPLLDKQLIAALIPDPVTQDPARNYVKVSWPNTVPGIKTYFDQVPDLDPSVYGDKVDRFDLGTVIFDGRSREDLVKIASGIDDQAKALLASYRKDNADQLIGDYQKSVKDFDPVTYAANYLKAKADWDKAQADHKDHQLAIAKILSVPALDVAVVKPSKDNGMLAFYVPSESFDKRTRERHVYNWSARKTYTLDKDSPLYGHYTADLTWTSQPSSSGKADWTLTLVSDLYGTIKASCENAKAASIYTGKDGVLRALHAKAVAAGNVTGDDITRKITASTPDDFDVPQVGTDKPADPDPDPAS